MKYYISIFFVLLFSFPAIAEDADERLKTIEDTLKKQQETIAELKGQKAVGRLRLMDTSIDAPFAAGVLLKTTRSCKTFRAEGMTQKEGVLQCKMSNSRLEALWILT